MPDPIDWQARALAAEADLAARATLGRPPSRALSPDARLVARVCARLSLRRGALAERLGVTGGILSRANTVPLAERHRVALRAMLEEPAVAPSEKSNRRRQKSS